MTRPPGRRIFRRGLLKHEIVRRDAEFAPPGDELVEAPLGRRRRSLLEDVLGPVAAVRVENLSFADLVRTARAVLRPVEIVDWARAVVARDPAALRGALPREKKHGHAPCRRRGNAHGTHDPLASRGGSQAPPRAAFARHRCSRWPNTSAREQTHRPEVLHVVGTSGRPFAPSAGLDKSQACAITRGLVRPPCSSVAPRSAKLAVSLRASPRSSPRASLFVFATRRASRTQSTSPVASRGAELATSLRASPRPSPASNLARETLSIRPRTRSPF